jgi:glutamine kinase
MKLIILAAGRSSSISANNEASPVCLNQFDPNHRILDRTLALGKRLNVERSILVGGYRLLDILKLYPDLKYYYNDSWRETASLASLLEAEADFTDDIVISYSDVVHRMNVVDSLLNTSSDIVVTYDSGWADRYEGRTQEAMKAAEVIMTTPDQGYAMCRDSGVGDTSNELEESLLGEFTGLLLVRKAAAKKLSSIISKLLANNPKSGIGELIEALTSDSVSYESIDVCGKWAELDSETDLEQFKFGTKAETLSRLEGVLEWGRILPQVMVSVGEWKTSRDQVIQNVQDAFGGGAYVVVRSSGINEDTAWASMAGNFESVLNVPTKDSDSLAGAIDLVGNSFMKNGMKQIDANQILIQPMLDEVVAAGVVFTEDFETSAPYYVVNYDESGSTESITSGSTNEHHTLVVTKKSASKIEDQKIATLLKSITEIEDITGYHSLDVEFAIRMESEEGGVVPRVYILQVRPIAAQKDKLRVSRKDVEAELDAIAKYINKDRATASILCGRKIAYGVMPDWNPAEIIGINPRQLAFSLYRYLITDQIWGESRTMCGYRSTTPRPGIISFAGKPYVDVRMSFTSFTPSTLREDLANRLVEYAVDLLHNKPALHDKVEFGVMPTVYDVNFSATLEALHSNGFTALECEEIAESYRELTNNIINGITISVDGELDKISQLAGLREQVVGSIAQDGISWSAVDLLLEQCRRVGTLSFSNLARFGFIGVIQLKGLVSRGVLAQERFDAFMASIQTVAKDFVNDLATLERTDLIKLYGHLRPGTYDVRCPAYHESFDAYVDLGNRPGVEASTEFALTQEEEIAIRTVLTEVGLTCEPHSLFDFIRSAVIGRERGKFEFTKNLSLALDYIVTLADEEGVDRDSLSYLEIQELLSNASRSFPSNAKHVWQSLINRRRREHIITTSIKLPELITNESDLEHFFLSESQPNYVTQTSVTAPIVSVTGPCENVDGKICLIKNADPGFDWIFSHEIAGLITAYGGANSHMAIRCAEFEIPAVIGCGEATFNALKKVSKVRLDCAGKRMEPIS